jgi:hypothetical protein
MIVNVLKMIKTGIKMQLPPTQPDQEIQVYRMQVYPFNIFLYTIKNAAVTKHYGLNLLYKKPNNDCCCTFIPNDHQNI